MKICIKFKNGINFTDEGFSIEYEENSASINFTKWVENKKYGSFKKIYSFYYGSINEIIVDDKKYDNKMKLIDIKRCQDTDIKRCQDCVYRDVPTRFEPCKKCLVQSGMNISYTEFINRWK